MREQTIFKENRVVTRCALMILWIFWGCLLSLGSVTESLAATAGACSNCHTMHNSQDGGAIVASGPVQKLLKGDCVGCHTGTNKSSTTVPYVFSTSADYGTTGTEGDTLAGGNFRWVATNSAYGHNVEGLHSKDTLPNDNLPPGYDAAYSPVTTNWAANQLSCAGTHGCHGTRTEPNPMDAMEGTHHSSSTGAVEPGGSTTPGTSYRALVGIHGYEDPDWEFKADATYHNQYKGVDSPETSETTTISSLCAQCHGVFHQENNGVSPWLRHPTDFDLASLNSSEYDAYNGGNGTNNPYSVVAPVASNTISGGPLSEVDAGDDAADEAIITCISCHRAHGTPYYKMMRWDYAQGTAPAGWTSCAICHRTKS